MSAAVALTDRQLRSLTVAAQAAITDCSDVMVRGCLKEHPDIVAYRLGLLTQMITIVRRHAAREEVSWRSGDVANGWPLPDPAAEHAQALAEYEDHTCCCPWCLVSRGHEDDDRPEAFSGTGTGWPPDAP